MTAANVETTKPIFYLKEEHAHPEGSCTPLGFWIYIMSDCLMFAALFATYGVLSMGYAAGPTPADLFNLELVAVNTAMLLLSSITFGFAMLAMVKNRQAQTIGWLIVTALFGLSFLAIEMYEFYEMIHHGATPQRSAFLSAFFTLVGTHGLHVTFGLIWMFTLMAQIKMHGLNAANKRRLSCLSMFWHFLDVIWIGVFTFVYLIGAVQ